MTIPFRSVLLAGNEERLTFLKPLLSSEHGVARVAGTQQEALRVLEREGIDCVLLDERLGDTPGLELLRRLDPDGPAVVALVREGREALAMQALALGCDECLWVEGCSRARLSAALECAAWRHGQERKRRAELEESERLVGAAAHDLKAPLRHVKSFAELAQRAIASGNAAKAGERLTHVRDAAARLSRLIDAVVDYVRLASVALSASDVDLEAIVDTLSAELTPTLAECGGSLERHGLPPAFGDAALISRALRELLNNAIEHRSEAAPRISVSGQLEEKRVKLVVSDNGPGIAPESRELAFQPLSRLSAKAAGTGYGLGLAVCRRIATRHGGTVTLDSEPGCGTRVVLELPATAGRNLRTQ